jgi:hypothetical protein
MIGRIGRFGLITSRFSAAARLVRQNRQEPQSRPRRSLQRQLQSQQRHPTNSVAIVGCAGEAPAMPVFLSTNFSYQPTVNFERTS